MVQQMKDMEVKERVDRAKFVRTIRQWLDDVEAKRDSELMVRDQKFTLPVDVLDKAKLEIEYEVDEGECELQFTMKWR